MKKFKIDHSKFLGSIISTIIGDESEQIVKKLFKTLSEKHQEIGYKIFYENKDLETVSAECELTKEHVREVKSLISKKISKELSLPLKNLHDYINEVTEEIKLEERYLLPQEFANLSDKAKACLESIKVKSINELANYRISELMEMRTVGQKVATEFVEFLKQNNMKFKEERFRP